MPNPVTSRQKADFATRAQARLELRMDISSENYTARRGEINQALDVLLATIFPRLTVHLSVAKLPEPESERTKANTELQFTWTGQRDFDTRVGLVKDYLSATHRKDVAVEVIRYVGPEAEAPLALTRNPLEASAFLGKGRTPEDYCAVAGLHVDRHAVLRPSNWMKGKLKAADVRLEASAVESWAHLPLQPHGADRVTLWELPVNPATWFHEEGNDELWSLAPRQALPLVAAAQRYPFELISWSVLLAGEPHLGDQIRAGTAPFVDLIGNQVRGDSDVWAAVPYCYENGGDLWLGDNWDDNANPNYGSGAFLRGLL